jgi:hypothetical protein
VTRNRLLAYAAAIGAVAALFDAVDRLGGLSGHWAFHAAEYRGAEAADVLALLGAVLTALAFYVAWGGSGAPTGSAGSVHSLSSSRLCSPRRRSRIPYLTLA